MTTSTSTLSIRFAAATDIGCRRENNEDSFGYDTEYHLYVVCDGMGGSAAGEVASGLAVRTLIETFATSSAPGAEASSLEDRLTQAVHEANRMVRSTASSNAQYSGMGTTMVLACFDGQKVLIGNVGDSRAYGIRGGVCRQITLDHSLVDEQLRMGIITPEQAATSEMQSVITRAIGVADKVEPDFFAFEPMAGDMLVLASDGLTRYAGIEDILAIAQPTAELTAICGDLIELAKSRGGVDNITCIVLQAVEEAVAEAATAAEPT